MHNIAREKLAEVDIQSHCESQSFTETQTVQRNHWERWDTWRFRQLTMPEQQRVTERTCGQHSTLACRDCIRTLLSSVIIAPTGIYTIGLEKLVDTTTYRWTHNATFPLGRSWYDALSSAVSWCLMVYRTKIGDAVFYFMTLPPQ